MRADPLCGTALEPMKSVCCRVDSAHCAESSSAKATCRTKRTVRTDVSWARLTSRCGLSGLPRRDHIAFVVKSPARNNGRAHGRAHNHADLRQNPYCNSMRSSTMKLRLQLLEIQIATGSDSASYKLCAYDRPAADPSFAEGERGARASCSPWRRPTRCAEASRSPCRAEYP